MFEYISSAMQIFGSGWAIYMSWKVFSYFNSNKGDDTLDKYREQPNTIVIGHQTGSKSLIKTVVSNEDDYISIDTYEEVSKRLEQIKQDLGEHAEIEIYLHTPGGDLFYSELIANMLYHWKGRTVAHVIGYSASGGTLIALSCDEIIMSVAGALGPIDPQIASGNSLTGGIQIPISMEDCQTIFNSICVEEIDHKNLNVLLLKHRTRKLMPIYRKFVEKILSRNYPDDKDVQKILHLFMSSRAHSLPIFYEECKEVNLHVNICS